MGLLITACNKNLVVFNSECGEHSETGTFSLFVVISPVFSEIF